jgi:hypothetical protein
MIRFLSAQRLCSALLLWLCCFGARTAAATDLTGNLTDPQGQLIPEATIRLLRRADSTRRETKTDAQGRFSFTRLDGGEYRLTAESPGFAVLTQTVAVRADGQQAENLHFSSLASSNESVTVTAAVS